MHSVGMRAPEGTGRRSGNPPEIEATLLQSHKLASVGTLVVGVAHDFNNLLTAILGCASAMRLRSRVDPDTIADLARIESTAKRASELTRQLLGVAREPRGDRGPVDIQEVVDEVVSLLEHTIDRRIRIAAYSSASQLVVMGDHGQLTQVILNLALNAADAMPGGGTLGFVTRLERIEAGPAAADLDLDPGRYVVTEVVDTGPGVPEAVRERIFQPFFTTKPPDRGTGMGLAIALDIARHHGGNLTLRNSPDCGATFSVYLPAVEVSTIETEDRRELPSRGSGRILIVDDEPMVRDATGEVLQLLGYQVGCARDGAEALTTYREQLETIDLIILDWGMPELAGPDCLRGLLEIDPQARVLVSTGYDLPRDLVRASGARGILYKPYTIEQLGAAVSAALRG